MMWIVLLTTAAFVGAGSVGGDQTPPAGGRLPAPDLKGKMTLEQALARRRSVRRYASGNLTPAEISQLCWAASGITEPKRRFRTAPSAGALYPLEIYLVTADGVFHYEPQGHALRVHLKDDRRRALRAAALGQGCVEAAPLCFVIAAAEERTAIKYGGRAWRYCLLEAGHVAQNIHLQATAISLGSVPVGAFHDDDVAETIRLPAGQRPIYLLQVGRTATPVKAR